MLLRKYMAVFKITVKETLAYRFDAIASAAFSVLKILLAYLLWEAIYEGKTSIAGYTFPMMLTYYLLITFFLRLAKSENIIWETADEVRTGSFTKYITRPIRHFNYCLFRSLGKGAFIVTVDILAFFIWIAIFNNQLEGPASFNAFIFTIFFMILGLLTILQIHYLIGLISFKTVDIAGPYFLVNNFMDFMSGGFIPLVLLPDVVRNVISYTPFYYIIYYPATIYLGVSQIPMVKALLVIVVWNSALLVFRRYLYKRMIQLFEGVGI